MRSVLLRLAVAASALAVAACASLPPPENLPARGDIRNFGLEARFALRLEQPYEPPQSASGRLSWQHAGDRDHILVANPLGQGIAEIERHPGGARLRTSDGKLREATDAGALLQEATGYPLPLGEMPAWLLGRPGPAGRLQSDDLGRPKRLSDSGWEIDYDYESDSAGALPARLTLRRSNGLEVRLRIEEWRDNP